MDKDNDIVAVQAGPQPSATPNNGSALGQLARHMLMAQGFRIEPSE